jgi:hypothetical protein
MNLEDLEPNFLWRYYQRGYHCMVRSGLYFRQLVRPALSHAYFQRAIPILLVYARANHSDSDLPPGFSEQMEACPLTLRDLLHLDYAICLGYAEALSEDPVLRGVAPVMQWPGPAGSGGVFIAADAVMLSEDDPFVDEYDEEDEEPDEDDGTPPPFDL